MHFNKKNFNLPIISDWLMYIQCVNFTILYFVWPLPETITIRHISLILGATLSLVIIFKYRQHFCGIRAVPIYFLATLFFWICFHNVFLSNSVALQQEEFFGIWKRVILGSFFALGFGLGLSSFLEKNPLKKILIICLCTIGPNLIYYIKFLTIFLSSLAGFTPPEWLVIYHSSHKFYIPKTSYVAFCIPSFAISLAALPYAFEFPKSWLKLGLLITLAFEILGAFLIFSIEEIKNGLIFSAVLLIIFVTQTIYMRLIGSSRKMVLIFFAASAVFLVSICYRLAINPNFDSLKSDFGVAIQVDKYDNWKNPTWVGYPINEDGKQASGTNYLRISWAIVASKMILDYPFGYGLIERSFGKIGASKWPESKLTQSHSGWIDLTLGIGIPGVLLILGAIFVSLIYLLKRKSFLNLASYYWLLSNLLIWITTELSQKIYFDALIFSIMFASGVIISSDLINLKECDRNCSASSS